MIIIPIKWLFHWEYTIIGLQKQGTLGRVEHLEQNGNSDPSRRGRNSARALTWKQNWQLAENRTLRPLRLLYYIYII